MSMRYLRTLNFLRAKMTDAKARADEGATAVEYGLLVSLIAVVIIAGVTTLGGNLSALFTAISGEIATVIP